MNLKHRNQALHRQASISGCSLLLAAAILLGGCAQTTVDRSGTTTTVTDDPTVVQLPEAAEQTAYSALLLEAQTLLQARQLLPAASILRDIDDSKLSQREQVSVVLMEVELRYLQGNNEAALQELQSGLQLLDSLPTELRQPLQGWQLRLLQTSSGALAAAQAADQMLVGSEDPVWRQSLKNYIWYNLQRSRLERLTEARQNAASAHWQAWLELAVIAGSIADSPDVQVSEIEFWQQRHPQHVASLALPGGLDSLAQEAVNAPSRIALLLPLSAGQQEQGHAVLEGYLAAQYEAWQRGWPRQELMVMDSEEFTDFNDAYTNAVNAGAELVIGPLSSNRPAGKLLYQQATPDPPVPLMTLTWLPPATEPPEPVDATDPDNEQDTPEADPIGSRLDIGPVQLGLSAIDEARQLADIAFAQGARRALLIRPAGDWGSRMSEALIDQWTQLEGEIQAIATFSGQADYSSSLKAALNLSASESRASSINRMLGETAEFSPRRRKDIDIVFLLSETPQDARSIKPLIAFHYAGDLPVYSTSQIFSGRRDPQRDRDLNGIRLVEMPWLLQPSGPLQEAVARGGGVEQLSNMYALGADAFFLNWRLQQLIQAPDNRIRAYTGLLNMDSSGRVHRELVPTRIRRGVPEPL